MGSNSFNVQRTLLCTKYISNEMRKQPPKAGTNRSQQKEPAIEQTQSEVSKKDLDSVKIDTIETAGFSKEERNQP